MDTFQVSAIHESPSIHGWEGPTGATHQWHSGRPLRRLAIKWSNAGMFRDTTPAPPDHLTLLCSRELIAMASDGIDR